MKRRGSSTVHLALIVVFVAVTSTLVESKQIAGDVILYGPNGLIAYVNKKGANIRVQRTVNGTGNSTGGHQPEHGFGQTGVVEVFLDAIEELDANLGNLKGNHKTSSFANIDFEIEALYNVSLPLSVTSNVTADCLNCSATLTKVGAGAKISMAVCAINANGTLDLNGELTNVTAGQLKITFTMANWQWDAASTTNKLAVDIVIKVPPGRYVSENKTDSKGKPAKFSLGAASFIEFSRMTYEDGSTWKEMPSGYPKYTSRGANNEFRLILGHFTRSSVYDPSLEVGYEAAAQISDPTLSPGSGASTVVPQGLAAVHLLLLLLLTTTTIIRKSVVV